MTSYMVHIYIPSGMEQDNKSSLVLGTAPNFNFNEICIKIFLQIYYVKIACKEDNQPVCRVGKFERVKG